MADVFDPRKRSEVMSLIRGKNTTPERIVRSLLHRQGFRFRLHVRTLPGHPDIVLPRYRAVVFIHGCFWHHHDCHLFRLPATRTDFWRTKIERNVEVDKRNIEALRSAGYRVGVVWECALKGRERQPPEELSSRLAEWLRSGPEMIEVRGGS